MGVLADGTPFLTQRGLARLCGVRNAHIGTISSEWNASRHKPRIMRIRAILSSSGLALQEPHLRLEHGTRAIFAYPESVCLAVLEYYAFHAGSNCRNEARNNFRALTGRALRALICAQVGYQSEHAVHVVGIAPARVTGVSHGSAQSIGKPVDMLRRPGKIAALKPH